MSEDIEVGGVGAAANQVSSAISAFAAFLPWFDAVNKVVEEILNVYDAAEYNKRTCRVLVDRVENVATAIRKLNHELETTCKDLQFGIMISLEDRNLEEKSLSEDVTKMTEFLKTIEGGVTDVNNQLKENHEVICHVNAGVEKVQEDTDEIKIKLNAIFEEVIEIKKKVYKREISLGAPHIDMNHLKEINERISSSTESRKIFKRLFNGIDVACKRITVPNDDEKWKMTKNRCENVMITDNNGYNAKLANFDLSRQRNENSIKIVSISEIIPWLAPEKMGSDSNTNNASNKKENPYTFKCEVFSYGMLLWELAFQQVPYKNMDTMIICEHVKAGKREHLNFTGKFVGPREVINGYSRIIKSAWAHEPPERPSINVFNYELTRLSELITSENPNHNDAAYEETDDEFCPTVADDYPPLIPPLEDGLRAHRDKSKREKAWECFEIHAELGDPVAKYWKGYYLKEGYYKGVKDPVEAVKLFKEAADENVPDAQLHYAFAMLEANNVKEFLAYLNKAVINGNPSALFNYGDLFLNGKLGIRKDEEKGIRYLKMAAVKGQPKALDELKKRHICL
ncbi:serine/threonine protein kinase [Gigaspora margarita]|uniref:Serine/threonine protein kinase n=1 Tax=Gigaspora margarita TaxID=4874 RepID=A0A8H4B5P0_GIGMA|nr:serine/threonine protein kinase [Gigaspora margarita]